MVGDPPAGARNMRCSVASVAKRDVADTALAHSRGSGCSTLQNLNTVLELCNMICEHAERLEMLLMQCRAIYKCYKLLEA